MGGVAGHLMHLYDNRELSYNDIADILSKANVTQVTDEDTIRKALKGKEIKMYDDGSYDRVLGGKKYRKLMFGKPTV